MILEGKAIVISGIGPGLGQELAIVAARQGARIAISARTPARLEEVRTAVAALGLGTEVLTVPTDIRDRAQCDRLVSTVADQFGRIDALINSGYITGVYAPAAEADLDDWRNTMDTNLFGTMTMIQAVVPHMVALGGGSIVNVNTKVARMPQETLGGYAVSKAALRMATTQLAKELGPSGVRLNSVFPGWMWGETVEAGFRRIEAAGGPTVAETRADIARRIPLGDIPEDGECAKAVIAMASDLFSAVTGACLDISGGEYMPL